MQGRRYFTKEYGSAPKKRGNGRQLLFPLAAVLAVALIGYLFPYHTALAVENPAGERILLAVSDGMTFSLEYLHSVNKVSVSDQFYIRGGEMVLDATEFENYGAGMPDVSDYPGAEMSLSESGVRLEGIGRVFPEIRIVTGTESGHLLRCRGRTFLLSGEYGEQVSLRICLRKVNLRALVADDPNFQMLRAGRT